MAMSISFEGRHVLVTGAARGLGRDIVKRLHEQNAVVYALARNQTNLATLKSDFPNIRTVCADLNGWDSTRQAVEALGQIDFLVNNAAVIHVAPFMNIQPDSFDEQVNTNVKAVINVSQVVAKGMIERGNGGCIINVSSMSAKIAAPVMCVYSVTKGALDSLTRSMAVELGPHNIRVVSVNPTMFLTDMSKNFLEKNPDGGSAYQQRTPLKRLANSEEIVNTVLFLMSDKAPMINGTSVMIDGGYTAN